MSEDRLIRWLRRRAAAAAGRSTTDRSLIGDDAAIMPDDSWAITVDTQIAGVHFPADLDPAVVARRTLAVNLSDLAAMGASPAYAFLALAAPAGFDHRRFLAALLRAGKKYGLALAGGDLARAGQITAVLTLLGQKLPARRWLLRSGARAGEHLWLGGTVGEAAAGCRLVERGARIEGRSIRLPQGFDSPAAVAVAARRAVRRHLLPQPQLSLGSWLGTCEMGAAIDVSDGLARDLHRLCAASGVGAEVELQRLPLGRDFERLARRLDCSWRRLALGGGEDYVLLFTLPAGLEPPDDFGCIRIGRMLGGGGRREPRIFLWQDGERKPLPPLGWDHLAPGAKEKAPLGAGPHAPF